MGYVVKIKVSGILHIAHCTLAISRPSQGHSATVSSNTSQVEDVAHKEIASAHALYSVVECTALHLEDLGLVYSQVSHWSEICYSKNCCTIYLVTHNHCHLFTAPESGTAKLIMATQQYISC